MLPGVLGFVACRFQTGLVRSTSFRCSVRFAGSSQARLESPGLGPGLDNVSAECEAVDDGLAKPCVGEDARPFAKWQVSGDHDAGRFIALGEDLEEKFGTGL